MDVYIHMYIHMYINIIYIIYNYIYNIYIIYIYNIYIVDPFCVATAWALPTGVVTKPVGWVHGGSSNSSGQLALSKALTCDALRRCDVIWPPGEPLGNPF
jgi:hypothetical protein